MKSVVAILVMFAAVMLLFWFVLPIRSDADRALYGWRAQLHPDGETATNSASDDR